ncbi:MAG: hypothetical protein ABF460_08385, partial [Oenococcus sp.]|uniref:hypothetical protein n=1 Tax=Oenococcus sp. TaxID=1979414 RepID=UPI0039EC4D14
SAISNSFKEALMIFNDKVDTDFKEASNKIKKVSAKKNFIFSLDEQIDFWGSTRSLKELDRMLKICVSKQIPPEFCGSKGVIDDETQFSFDDIEEAYKEVWFVNLKNPILKNMGLFSVKCFSPNLMNMYFFQDFYSLAKGNGLYRPLAIPIA